MQLATDRPRACRGGENRRRFAERGGWASRGLLGPSGSPPPGPYGPVVRLLGRSLLGPLDHPLPRQPLFEPGTGLRLLLIEEPTTWRQGCLGLASYCRPETPASS